MRRISPWRMFLLALVPIVAAAPPARADWAVLRNGQSLHITGYERQGSLYVLHISGGEARLPVADVLRFEPEDIFPAPVVQPAIPSGPYGTLVRTAALKNGLSPRLLSSIIRVESSFQPRAVSPKHALGLMQLMPGTARALGVQNRFNPAQNIQAGAQYLKQLLEKFGNLNLALAAYNAGPGAVRSFRGIPPFRETRAYIAQVRSDMKRPDAPNPQTETVELTCTPRAQRCRERAMRGSVIMDHALP